MLGVFALAWGVAWALVNRYNYTVCVCAIKYYTRIIHTFKKSQRVQYDSRGGVCNCRAMQRRLVRQNRTRDSGLTRFDNSSSRHVDKLLSSRVQSGV